MKKISLSGIIAGLVMSCTVLLNACSVTKGYQGTVQKIEMGKDGYTAYLQDQSGKSFDAVFSIPRMEKGYRLLKVGEQVKIQGDTIHFDNRVRVLAKSVK